MTADQALHMLAQLFWNSFLIAGPVLGATLLIGLLVSVFQVVTQLQEMSLSYIPKLIVAAVVIIVFAPWMLSHLIGFTTALFNTIPSLG